MDCMRGKRVMPLAEGRSDGSGLVIRASRAYVALRLIYAVARRSALHLEL